MTERNPAADNRIPGQCQKCGSVHEDGPCPEHHIGGPPIPQEALAGLTERNPAAEAAIKKAKSAILCLNLDILPLKRADAALLPILAELCQSALAASRPPSASVAELARQAAERYIGARPGVSCSILARRNWEAKVRNLAAIIAAKFAGQPEPIGVEEALDQVFVLVAYRDERIVQPEEVRAILTALVRSATERADEAERALYLAQKAADIVTVVCDGLRDDLEKAEAKILAMELDVVAWTEKIDDLKDKLEQAEREQASIAIGATGRIKLAEEERKRHWQLATDLKAKLSQTETERDGFKAMAEKDSPTAVAHIMGMTRTIIDLKAKLAEKEA